MSKIEITPLRNVHLSKLKVKENNAKLHPLSQIRHIANSMCQFGYVQPIVVDQKFNIIVGTGRYLALCLLEVKKVPVVFQLPELPESTLSAMSVIDNKINADTGWIQDNLQFEMEFLSASNLKLDSLSLDFDAAALFGKVKPSDEDAVGANVIKSLILHFPDAQFPQVLQALQCVIDQVPGCTSNTEAFVWLLEKYGHV